MKNKTYDFLRNLLIILPAVTALYVSLADIWKLPCEVEISATINAVMTFLGIVLKLSSNKYWEEENNDNRK